MQFHDLLFCFFWAVLDSMNEMKAMCIVEEIIYSSTKSFYFDSKNISYAQ